MSKIMQHIFSKKDPPPIDPAIRFLSPLELKALAFSSMKTDRQRKQWYKDHKDYLYIRLHLNRMIRKLLKPKIRFKPLDATRWAIVDFLRAKPKKFWGVYQFVAMPGEGKTISMVAHMERALKDLGKSKLYIATNFYYANQDMAINHWSDMIKAAKYADRHNMHSIIALDEIHTTFDASDWKSFPQEMLSLLSFNRKYGMQFLCSAQIYDRIPKKVRDIANYTIICKNFLGADRYFKDYYFKKVDYEDKFSGRRARADFTISFVADDHLYALYDTRRQVDKMTESALAEQNLREKAFRMLFEADADQEDAPQ